MIIKTIKKEEVNPDNICTYCEKSYRKQDYTMCPHCGGDAGGRTPKGWKPTKKQKKAYASKMNKI